MRISDWSSDVCSSDLLAGEVGHVRAHFAALPREGPVLQVYPIGRGVLADDEQFLRPGGDQLFGLPQHRIHPAAHQIATDRGDDAKGAAVIEAFGNLKLDVVARRQLQPRFAIGRASCWEKGWKDG